MSMFNDTSSEKKDNEEDCGNAKVVSIYTKKFGIGQRSLLVQVPRRSAILWERIAPKEFGIISRKRCWWNSQRADVQFSVLRLQCLEVSQKAKDVVKCRYILPPTKKEVRLFFAFLFLQISSVFTDQSQTCVKNVNPVLSR